MAFLTKAWYSGRLEFHPTQEVGRFFRDMEQITSHRVIFP